MNVGKVVQNSFPAGFKNPTILLVDDTPANLDTLYSYFESLGFEIMMAQNGPTALKRVAYFKPDIILLDVLMPGMDGFETCRRLKADEATKYIPIIFMTALNDTVHKLRGFEVGAADYITKPFHIEEVFARVQTHLAVRNLQAQLQIQNERLQIEIQDRQKTAAALQEANEQQELQVKRRTAELAKANAKLEAEIVERRQAEAESRKLATELGELVQSRNSELAGLYKVTALAGKSLTLETILARALEAVLELTQLQRGAIYLAEEPLSLAAQVGFSGDDDARLLGDELAARIVSQDQIITADLTPPPHVVPDRRVGYFGVPIRAGSGVLGALSVYTDSAHDLAVDTDPITLLTAIADHIGIVVESTRLRQAAEQAAMLEERSRLARELHDSVTQLMYSINLFARAGKDAYRLNNATQGELYLTRLEETARQALKELRLLLFELRPPELDQEGLVGALQLRLDSVEGRAGVKTQLLVEEEADLPEDYEESLYAIAQEALNNALKHANATAITVQLQVNTAVVQLSIVDNGIGFGPDSGKKRGGMGMATMRERTESLGGEFAVKSAPAQGVSIQLTLPAAPPGKEQIASGH